jgi:fused signal recognition particle receptor
MARSWAELLGEGAADETEEQQAGFFGRLRDSLSRSRRALTDQFAGFDPNDEGAWEDLEEALIAADVGVRSTAELVRRLEERGGLEGLEDELASLLGEPGVLNVSARPSVILVVGVNGTGKTTTIGKLAAKLREHGHSVLLAAADTYRAAAEEQLEIWAERSAADFVGAPRGGDPAAVAFDAIEAATARGRDVVIVDTAGRLHTQANLMEELAKVRRVIAGKLEGAPHETLLVVDATTGQNGLQQARLFDEAVDVSGVALTKLDGSAKGGIAVAIAHELELPVKLIGVGEGLEDLRPFDAREFARALVGS